MGYATASSAESESGMPRPAAAAAATHHLLHLGELVATPGALAAIADDRDEAVQRLNRDILNRFIRKDWGDVSAGDRKANDDALAHGGRILAVYTIRKFADGYAVRLYVIREIVDENGTPRTTVLLPEEY